MNNVKELATNRWHDILASFMPQEALTGKHTACPICGGRDRFRWDNLHGNGTFYCSQCGAGSGIHLLSLFLGISHSEAWRKVESVVSVAKVVVSKPAADKAERVRKILDSCYSPAKGGEIETYLASRCIYEIPSSILESRSPSGATLMVCKFALDNKMRGLHVTFIRDGQKDESGGASKKMYSIADGSLKGSAIRLNPLNGGSRIVVGEGIETTLSASKIFEAPGWATGSAGLMEDLKVPEQITEVIIAGDHDESFTGQAAAYALAKRLKTQGKLVRVEIPKYAGEDWNSNEMKFCVYE